MGRDKSIMGNCAKRSKSGNKARNDEAGRRGTDRTESRRAMRREAEGGAALCLQRTGWSAWRLCRMYPAGLLRERRRALRG